MDDSFLITWGGRLTMEWSASGNYIKSGPLQPKKYKFRRSYGGVLYGSFSYMFRLYSPQGE